MNNSDAGRLEDPRPAISVVIPVYRSEMILDRLHDRLTAALDELGETSEIVFVDDSSPDDSWNILQRLTERPGTRAIQLMKNSGQQRAVLAGIHHARGEFIVTMDDDLQHRPEEIYLLLREIRETGNDVIIGRYSGAKKHSALRRMGTRLVSWLAHSTIGVPEGLELTSFRIMRRQVAVALDDLRPYNPVVGYMLTGITHRISNVDVSHDERDTGTSNYSTRSLVRYFRSMVMDYSDLPLRLVGIVGMTAAGSSVLLGMVYLVAYLAGAIQAAGFVTPVLLTLFLSGLILASIGIIGAYLVRILSASAHQAVWSVRSEIGSERD